MLIAKLALCTAILAAADGAAPAKPTPQAKPAQTAQPKETAKPKEAAKPTEAAKPEQSAQPKEAAKSKEPARPSEDELFPVERAIIEQTNSHRARYGLPPLEVDVGLVKSARAHAIWMTTYQTLQHTGQPVAENIAMGQRDQYEVLNSWMGSSGHRANILNGAFRRIGVAAYQGGRGTIFWCQQFR